MSHYQESLSFVKNNRGSSSAIGMAKLILSLYNDNNAFSLSECVKNFDRERLNLASLMIGDYFANGETSELINAAHEIFEFSPDLKELADAASDAKSEVRAKWRREKEAKWAADEASENE